MQMLNKEFGGSVIAKDIREDGQEIIDIDEKSNLFKGKFVEVPRLIYLTSGLMEAWKRDRMSC